ncbi:MAG: glycosyltransferase, partial [Proteobacteria bacterium]|nr:glycosyltransferase [Pseudomonadota bacterium]
MKLLFLIRSLEAGGAERQLTTVTNELAERGHEVHIAVFYGGGALEADLVKVSLHDLEKQGRWDTVGFLSRLVRLIRSLRPDVAHGYLGTANLLLALVRPFLPATPVVWGVRASNMNLGHYSRLHQVHFRMERLCSGVPIRIVYNSVAGRTYAEGAGFDPTRGITIPNGIDTKRFQPCPADGTRLRKQWNIPATSLLVGLPARLDPMKDHPTFLKAAYQLARNREGLRFVCVGGGPKSFERTLRTLASDLGLTDRLVWAGSREDMPAVYSAMDLCCLSSAFGEGFPNVLGEAMACGVPCVTTNVGDAAQVVGELGLVVSPGDTTALSEALAAMSERLEMEGAGLKAACRASIEERYGVDQMVKRTEALLREIVQ